MLMTWQTYKKKFNPDIYSVRDSTKGWIRTIVAPTMRNAGFYKTGHEDIITDSRKPKQIVLDDFKEIVDKSELVVYFVYHPTASYAGYFTALEIYYKPFK